MNIPYNSPIRWDKWEEEINEKAKEVNEKGMAVTGIILNPLTVSEVVNWKIENEPNSLPPHMVTEYLGMYKMIGNPDIKQYEYRFEVAYV